MVLWWIGNVVLLVVVLPVVIALLNRVLAAAERIRAATDEILAGGVALIGELDGSQTCWPRPTGLSMTSPLAPSATRAPSRSCSAKERRTAMPAAAWMTLVVAGLIIAITAVGLIRVIFHLRAIRATLRATTGGVQAIAQLTAPCRSG